ncbi:MAG: hypothetical protein ACFB50_05320 [Rubrobacteraceae bacterium]
MRPENNPFTKLGSVWETWTVGGGDGIALGYSVARHTSDLGGVWTGEGTDGVHPPGRGDVATDPCTLR